MIFATDQFGGIRAFNDQQELDICEKLHPALQLSDVHGCDCCKDKTAPDDSASGHVSQRLRAAVLVDAALKTLTSKK